MIDIEKRMSFDERSAVNFNLALRIAWANELYPAMIGEVTAKYPAIATIGQATERLHEASTYPWFSHIERAQQKMSWKIAQDVVIGHRNELLAELDSAVSDGSCLCSLVLNPELELPKWYTDYDIHVQPGSFYSDDLSAFIYELGARIVMLRDNDGYKFHRLFGETALPDIPEATRVLDMGCGFGKSTRPLVDKYPTAEVIGVDLSAAGLRLAYAQATASRLPIHYKQADARATGLEDASCDLVTGTMVLHELPLTALRQVIREASRVLKPGGELRFLEFNLTGDHLRDATIYEHAERNNEPFFRSLFATDVPGECLNAGLLAAAWTPFDERSSGLSPDGWGDRKGWHFPWAVLSATKPL